MVSIQRAVARLFARYADLAESLAELTVGFLLLYAAGRLVVEPAFHRLVTYRDVEPTLRRALERVVGVSVVLAAAAVAASFAGFGNVVGGSAVIVAAATVALGFAAQDVVGNLVSGTFIVTDPKFNIGDWIEWDEKSGVIEDISFRATRVRTFNNEIITVPNSELTTNAVTNPVVNDRLRIEQPFDVDYDADLDGATDALVDVARAHSEVLDDPPPSVRLTELADDAVVLTARLWIADPARVNVARVRDEYARAAIARLDERGVELSPPAERELSGELGVDDAPDR